MYKNIYYFNTIQKIGGIETFFYELAKKYNDYDLTFIYKNADEKQLKRLKKLVRCVKYKSGDKIICDKAFFNFNTDIIDSVEANEYCLVVHGDYKMLKGAPPQHPKITKYYGVSKTACDSFTELTGLPCELVYNPISKEKIKPVIHLLSASRLKDKVKGQERMKALVKALDSYCEITGNKYQWTIFTDDYGAIDSNNVCYMKPRLDIRDYIADSDYVIQLSDDFEGYNYTVNEALIYKVPVVITPCKVFKELGINNNMSIRLDFELSNIDEVVRDIFDKYKTFVIDYNPPKDSWNKLLIAGKGNYKEELKTKYKVEALPVYEERKITDSDLNRVPKAGESWIVTKERKDILSGENVYKEVFVNVIEVIKEDKTEVLNEY